MKTIRDRILSLSLICISALFYATSSSGAEVQAPVITGDLYSNHPRLTWTNVLRESYQLLTSERIDSGEWTPWLTLSTDGTNITWTDETAAHLARFYRVSATAETNWAAKLQAALDRTRRSTGARGASAVVITTNGIWQGSSGNSTTKPFW